MIFAWVAIGCGAIAVICAFCIYIEEDVSERTYGNGKETGFRQRDSEYRG